MHHLEFGPEALSEAPDVSISFLFFQVGSAMSYLHEKEIIYRDLKSDNVLVWSFPPPTSFHDFFSHLVRVKLTDYGISRSGKSVRGPDGTPRYMAPEVLKYGGRQSYGVKVSA